MPYSTPTSPTPVVFPSQGRPGHRRSYTHIIEPGYPAASASSSSPSVSTLPRRKPTTSAPPAFAGAADDSSPQKKPPTFQLGRDDDDDDDSSDETPLAVALGHHDDDDRTLPPLRLKLKQSSFDAAVRRGSPPPKITLHPPTAVPFPRSSPTHSPNTTEAPPLPHTRSTSDPDAAAPPAQRLVRPSVTRTTSSPILLSNGKPLKSSLKGSSSSPHIPFPPQSLVPSIMFPDLHRGAHQRARSAPSTPHLDLAGSSTSSASSSPPLDSPEASEPPSPTLPHKNVHFPSQEEGGLATVRVFNRSAKPASLSRLGEDTETETEGESSAREWTGLGWSAWGGRSAGSSARTAGYPFPRLAGQNGGAANRHSPLGRQEEKMLEVDVDNSTPVPARGAEKGDGNVYLESMGFVREVPKHPAPKRPLVLAGTLLVRNVTYQKTVAVRFTMDDWHTTNDVLATHEKSLGALPARFVLGAAGALASSSSATAYAASATRICTPYAVDTPGADVEVKAGDAPAWDRFRFEIQLEDLAPVLDARTMWLVGRYSAGVAPGAGVVEVPGAEPYAEWWDNNGGANYRVAFRRVEATAAEKEKEKEGGEWKRGVVVSAPSVYPPSPRPTATSPAPKSVPAPPQISASVSLPASLADLAQYQQQQRLQQLHQPHQAAVAQSTLARLRKLNLRNYAAPAGQAGVVSSSAAAAAAVDAAKNHSTPERAMSTSSASSTDSMASSTDSMASSTDSMDSLSTASSSATSTESTPLQTPTQDDTAKVYVHQGPRHDLDLDVLGGAGPVQRNDDEEEEGGTPPARARWGATMVEGPAVGVGAKGFADAFSGAGGEAFRLRLGAGSSPVSSGATTPTPEGGDVRTPTPTAAMDIGNRAGEAVEGGMGTSPPFSAMAEAAAAVRARASPGADAHTPRGPALYWPWGSFGAVGEEKTAMEPVEQQQQQKTADEGKLVTPPLSAPVETLLSGIKEKSVDAPHSKLHAHANAHHANAHHTNAHHASAAATAQILPPHRRRAAHPHPQSHAPATSSVSGSGSASSSGSESAGGKHTHYRRPVGSSSPLSPAAERAQGFPFHPQRPGSPRPGSPRPAGNGASSPGVRSPLRMSPVHSFADLGAATSSDAPSSNAPSSNATSSSDSASLSPPLSPGGQDDAVYQAFVRQWCFAQAPGPTVGASAAGGGEGPRLVVG